LCGGAALAQAVLIALAISLAALRARAEDEGQRPRAEARVRALPVNDLPDDPSAFATVIEVDDYRGEGKSVADLLADTVGVQVRRFGGPGDPAEVSIRGSTSQQVVVLLDGIRLNSAQVGSVDLSTIPLAQVERIEVSRGGGSTEVGSDAVGGVINIVTRRPGAEPSTRLAFSGGSFGTWAGSASHSRQLEGDRSFLVGYDGFATQGDWHFQTAEIRTDVATVPSREEKRINNDSESHSGLLRVFQGLPDGWQLTFTDQLYYRSRGAPGLDLVQQPDARERRTRNVADALLERDDWLGGAVRTEARLFHRYERVRYRDPDPVGPTPPASTRDVNQSGGSRLRAEWDTATGPVTHLATGRVELRRDTLSSRDFGHHDRWVVGVFAQDELAVWADRVSLVPALRLDYSEGDGSAWIPRAGARVALTSWARIKANVEKSYRVPNYDERYFDLGSVRGNPNLDPEESWDWDAGLDLGVADVGPFETLRFEAVYFERDIQNSIVFQQVSPNTVAATNTNDASVVGVELSGSLDLWGWLQVSASYTRQDSDNEGSALDVIIATGGSSRPLPGRPDEEWSLRESLGPPSGAWKLACDQHYTSSIPLNASGKSTISSRTTIDTSLVLDLVQLSPWKIPWSPKSALFSVAATNVTDEAVRDALGFPQPGRSLMFRGELRW